MSAFGCGTGAVDTPVEMQQRQWLQCGVDERPVRWPHPCDPVRQPHPWEDEQSRREEKWARGGWASTVRDDASGMEPVAQTATDACELEMKPFEDMHEFTIYPRERVEEEGCALIPIDIGREGA